MVETTSQEYITREADWMEAERRAQLADTKKLIEQRAADIASGKVTLPKYSIAAPTKEQTKAVSLASKGIGAYEPYLKSATSSYKAVGKGGEKAAKTAAAAATQANQYITQAKKEASPYLTDAKKYYELMGKTGQKGADLSEKYGSRAATLAEMGMKAYDPNSVTEYMNPYQQQVIDNMMAEMNRQAAIQKQGVSSQAAIAGAFGGSRFGVQQAELGRNLAQVQGNALAQQYAQNYNQAQQAAMEAFQNQQARTQQAAQTTLGAGSLASSGQFNLAGQQGAEASGIAGLGAQQFGMGQAGAQTALTGGQLQSGAETQAAQLAAQQAAGEARLGELATSLSQGDASFLYNIGEKQRLLTDQANEAKRKNTEMANLEPFKLNSYYADILNKTPSGSTQYTTTSSPSPSLASQAAGVGITGLAAYNAFK